MNEPSIDRFNEKWEAVTESGCWIWTASINNYGYGKFFYKQRPRLAHRLSYEIYVGEINKGMCVCHRCDVTSCVNPGHLFLGTHKENMYDMISKGRFKGSHHGEAHPRAKLTYQDVKDIRASSMTRAELMKYYDVSHSTIDNIANFRARLNS